MNVLGAIRATFARSVPRDAYTPGLTRWIRPLVARMLRAT